MSFQTVIGLEVHAQLKTQSKLFSGTATTYGAKPNSQTSFIDAGLPGVLPVLNEAAVKMAIQFGLAIKARIHDQSIFERKNYFYPDLPKGYQISQFQHPIVSDGQLKIDLGDGQLKTVDILRAHLEEDAGKSLHDISNTHTGIDLNRAGTPLLEIVTTPCLHSSKEVVCYLKSLHQLLLFLNLCDGNMQEGSFRCDVNVSLRPIGQQTLGTRTELKNLNSFKFIEKALAYEVQRHTNLLLDGQPIHQETRLYCPVKNCTEVLRRKENENDYRYFPDPDLLPIAIDQDMVLLLKKTMPALPADIRSSLEKDHLSTEDIDYLLTSPAVIQYFNDVKTHSHAEPKMIVNWLKGVYQAALHEQQLSFEQPPIAATKLATLLNKLQDNVISNHLAKRIFAHLLSKDEDIDFLIKTYGVEPLNDGKDLDAIIKKIIETYKSQADDYRSGKDKLLAFFVGQVMKEMKGKVDPAAVSERLRLMLREL